MKTFAESQFEVMSVYVFQAKANFYEDISWASIWTYVSLSISKKSEFLWRYSLSLTLKVSEFTSFKKNQIVIKTFVESQFEVM